MFQKLLNGVKRPLQRMRLSRKAEINKIEMDMIASKMNRCYHCLYTPVALWAATALGAFEL